MAEVLGFEGQSLCIVESHRQYFLFKISVLTCDDKVDIPSAQTACSRTSGEGEESSSIKSGTAPTSITN